MRRPRMNGENELRGRLAGAVDIIGTLKRIVRDRKASTALTFALLSVPFMGAVGAAVDFSRASASRTAMQAVLDATALAMVKQAAAGSSTITAEDFFAATFAHPEVQNVRVTSNVSSDAGGTTVALRATGDVNTTFMGVMGYSVLNLQVASSANMVTETTGCILALDANASGAISMGGNTGVDLSDCSLLANSSDSSAVSIGGSSTLSALSVGAVGGVSIASSNVTLSEGVRTNLQPIIDPYADVTVPSFSGCAETNLTVKTTLTIEPGVYCNGISVHAGAVLTLNPGIYYIDRGVFSVNGGATINGQGVTLIFTSSTGKNWPSATINGNAVVNLTAMRSGATAGLVIFGDRNAPVGTAFKLNGGSSQIFGGAIYAPTGAISYSGGANTSTSCTQIIGNTVSLTGDSKVAINCSGYSTKPFGPTTLRLMS